MTCGDDRTRGPQQQQRQTSAVRARVRLNGRGIETCRSEESCSYIEKPGGKSFRLVWKLCRELMSAGSGVERIIQGSELAYRRRVFRWRFSGWFDSELAQINKRAALVSPRERRALYNPSVENASGNFAPKDRA